VKSCAFELNGTPTTKNLNLLPLGSYSMLLGINWFFIHRTKVTFYEKFVKFLDEAREKRFLLGKRNPTLMMMIMTIKAKHNRRKIYLLFLVHVSSDKMLDNEDGKVLRRYPMLQ